MIHIYAIGFENMYLIIYPLVCILAVILGIRIFQLQKRSMAGLFFLLFTIFLSIWFINYFLFFTNLIRSPTGLLYSSRINFIIGIITVYTLLLFVAYFNSQKPKSTLVRYVFIPVVTVTSFLYIGTESVIKTLRFDVAD